jgi:phytoene dehydrogenase-like protein
MPDSCGEQRPLALNFDHSGIDGRLLLISLPCFGTCSNLGRGQSEGELITLSSRLRCRNQRLVPRPQQPISQQQFGMIVWPTFSDPALAPEGKHVLTVTVVGAYKGVDWDTRLASPMTFNYLSRELIPGLADHVAVAECATPIDFERRIELGKGGLHGITQDAAHTTVSRPPTSRKSIDGLYL